jgi:hypothetical protein
VGDGEEEGEAVKECFVEKNFRPATMETIERANTIISDYRRQGLRLTLRQLYYQFVSKNWITNTERSYKNLGSILNDARLAGLVDWAAIEDRNREPVMWAEYDNIKELIESSIDRFRLPRWKDQEHYVELWVEKAALAGVLEPLAAEFHVTLMVNRGYSSASAMYESAQRFARHCDGEGRNPTLFYLGDHDPSGEDMVRDIKDRLVLFGVSDIRVEKLALTMEQVRQYHPPPNPAKTTDSRHAGYVTEHGTTSSWEVDALNPATLAQIIRKAFKGVIDPDKMQAVKAKEAEQRSKLEDAVARIVEETEEN